MATNDDLISRIKQSRIGKAVSNVLSDSAKGYRIAGRAINNSPQRQQFSRGVQGFSNFVNKLEASPVGAPSRFVQGQGKQVANWIQSAGSNLGQAAYQVGYNRQQNLPTFQNTGSNIRKGIVPAVQAITFPLSGLNPGTYLAQSGLSGAINKATGGSFIEGASQGAATAGLTSAFIRGTNPIINRGLSALPTRLPGQVTSRIAPAVGNVAQGIGLDIASGNKTTPLSVGFDVVTGLAGGKGQFASSGGKNLDVLMKKGEALGIKGVSPRVNKVHPEDLDVMREFSDKILRQKGSKKELGELGVAAQRLAEHYFGGDWKYANNKKLAQAFEWAIDLNMNIPREARGQLPKLGLSEDSGQSVVRQMRTQPTKGVEALIEEARKYKSAEEFVKANNKGLSFVDALTNAKGVKSDIVLDVSERSWGADNNAIVLSWIETNKKATGKGTEIIEQLKSYADAKNKPFYITNVSNKGFWESFPFLKKESTGYVYDPREGIQPFSRIKSKLSGTRSDMQKYIGSKLNVNGESGAIISANISESGTPWFSVKTDSGKLIAVKMSDVKPINDPLESLKAEARKYKSAEEFVKAKLKNFRDGHAAPSRDTTPVKTRMEEGGDFSLREVIEGYHIQPSDYFDPTVGPRYYGYGDTAGMETLTAIGNVKRKIKAGKNPKITVYRTVPKEINQSDLIDYDWVSPSKQYVLNHGESRFGEGEYKIIEKEVDPSELWWDGNDIREWGYDSGKSEQQLTDIYNQAKGETIVNPLTGETIPKPTGRQAGFIDFGAKVGGDQLKPQQSIEPPAVKSMELESSKKTASKIKTQKQKELTFRGEQPVQGGSKLRVKQGSKVKASPSKVSSDVSITRDNKYAFNINKKKLNLNEEQSKQLDNVVETMRPVLEANKGKTLTKQEIIEAGRKANLLQDTIGREESKKFAESLQASRNFLKSEQAQVGITPKFLEQLEIVSSNAADAGRRLQSFNIGAEDVTIKEKVLSDILKIGADVDEVLKAGKNVDWNDAKQITDFYRKFKPASLADKLQEFRYTNMLSSPNTHIVNSFSNILQTAVLAPIEKAIRGTTSFAESRLTGKEQEYFARQGVDYLKGYWKALPDAVKKFSDTIKGVEGLRKPDIDFIPTSTSKVRQIYTLPLQALEASDQFFRTLVKGGEIESLKREGITGARASKLAEESADYRTFRQAFDPEGKLGQNKVLQVWDKWNVAVNNLRNVPGGKWIVPFLQTPTNILKQGFEYSPLGALTIKGSARPHEQLAKTIIGSSVFAGAYALADSGLTTWDAPTNSTERAEFYAAGLQPYSVKIGDKWVSYSKLGPLSYPIAMASALKWAQDEGAGDDVLKTMGRSMAGTLGFFADQSYVRGIGDIIDAFRGDEFKQARGLSNIPSQLIPYRSFMGWVTRLVDPVYRKTSGGSVPEQIGKSIISQIPGLSQNLEAYQTPFGTDSERQFPLVNAVSPLSVTQERTAEKEYYDARQNIRTQKKEVNKVLEDIENGKDIKIDSNKLLTDQVISLTKKKIEAGLEVTPQELETVYLGKVTSLPKDNRYDKSIRDSKLYAKFGTIEEDENITETQKQYLYEKIATELDKPIEDLKTYQVAKDVVPRKTLYVYDKMDSMQSKDELMAFLAQGRRPINGQILISDGVVDNLVSDGVIPYELGKELKKYDLNEDGTQKTTKNTSGGGSKKGTTKNDQEIAKIKAYGKYLDAISKITPTGGYPQGKIPTTKINVQGLTFGS